MDTLRQLELQLKKKLSAVFSDSYRSHFFIVWLVLRLKEVGKYGTHLFLEQEYEAEVGIDKDYK